MKPLYKKFETAKKQTKLVFNLVALLADTAAEVAIADLDRLCIRLVRPGISGALLLSSKNFAGNYIVIDGDEVSVYLATPEGKNRVTVEAEFGTNTRTLAIVDVFTTANESGVFEAESITTPVVKQLDGVSRAEFDALLARMREAELELAGKADGEIYRVGESGDPAVRDVAKIYSHSVEMSAHAEATGLYAVAEGSGKATGAGAHAEGEDTLASGENAHAEGKGGFGEPYEVNVRPLTQEEKQIILNKDGYLRFDYIAENDEIDDNTCPILYSDENCTNKVAEIIDNAFSTELLSSIGITGDFFAVRNGALQEGTYWARLEPRASGICSHTEGGLTEATGNYSHAEGFETAATGDYSHAEGYKTNASAPQSHAEGYNTIAAGNYSHAEGISTEATGKASHAEGVLTIASGDRAHACGEETVAAGFNQFVCGAFNIKDGGATQQTKGEFVFIVGNGTSDNNRSNAIAIKWDGTLVMWNSGNRVELTPAKLAALLALV